MPRATSRSPSTRSDSLNLASLKHHGGLTMPEQPNRPPHIGVRPPRPPSAGLPALSPRHIVFVTPLILLHLACGLVAFVGVSKPAIAVFLCASSVQIFGITVGYHRLLAHRS